MTRVLKYLGAATAVALLVTACVTSKTPAPPVAPGAPKYPQYPAPDVPAALAVAPDVRAAHTRTWAMLQSGDLRGAERDFTALIKTTPSFYPAETGLGFALLAEKQYKQAQAHFSAALAANATYLPALSGQADTQLAQNDEAGAIVTFSSILAIDPKNDAVRSRLDLLQFRQVQSLIDGGRKARDAGRLDEAEASFEKALTLSPTSAVIFRELALVEQTRGELDQAETHARRATQVDAGDAEAFAVLAGVLEARGNYRDAVAAYGQALKIDPRPAWKARADALAEKAEMAGVPPEFKTLETNPTVSRAQLAALIGMRLEPVLTKATQHVTAVATDVRGHWAENWIMPVTQTGVMDVYPNHTFQPGGIVKRSDLARVVSQLLTIIATERPIDLAKWRAARPVFPDLPVSNVYYGLAAVSVAAGAMSPVDGSRFAPTASATGASVVAAVTRLQQIAGREP